MKHHAIVVELAVEVNLPNPNGGDGEVNTASFDSRAVFPYYEVDKLILGDYNALAGWVGHNGGVTETQMDAQGLYTQTPRQIHGHSNLK